MGCATLRHFRDELFDDDVEHGAGGEAQQIRKSRNGDDVLGRQDGQEGADGLDDTGEDVPPRKARRLCSCPRPAEAWDRMAPSGKFWMAMPRESASAPAAVVWAGAGQVAGVDDADGHAFRDVVECDGQEQHGGALQAGVSGLRPVRCLRWR